MRRADCNAILKAILETVREAVTHDEDVVLVGFGTFTTGKYCERTYSSMKPGKKGSAEIIKPARRVPRFNPIPTFVKETQAYPSQPPGPESI